MMSRISNTATKEQIEFAMDAKFQFGNLYAPTEVINGMKETSACVITANDMDQIKFGIWGILPVGYENGWKDFQSENNTLTVDVERLKTHSWLLDAFENRRCLIIATGFFTSQVKNSKLYPFINNLDNSEIFCFGGIYNVLDDGFISFAILSHSNNEVSDIMMQPKPVIINPDCYSRFLDSDMDLEQLCDMQLELDWGKFSSTPVSRKIYNI